MEKNNNISNSLQKKFLYKDDTNSIHLLINMYKSENLLGSSAPDYISLATLKRFLKRNLKDRNGKDLAAKNIAELLHNDINKLELLIFLESYKDGFNLTYFVNRIEKDLISSCGIKPMYSRTAFKNAINCKLIKYYKHEILRYIREEKRAYEKFIELLSTYTKKVIKPKIFNVNMYLDNQVKMVDTGNGKAILKFEDSPFSKREIIKLYSVVNKLIFEDSIRLIFDGYWDGVVEKLLRRYK